jgi:hypothetical protein
LGTLRLERLDVDGHELREGFPARALFIWWQRSEQLGVCAPNAVESLVRDRLSVVKLPKQRHPGRFAPPLDWNHASFGRLKRYLYLKLCSRL